MIPLPPFFTRGEADIGSFVASVERTEITKMRAGRIATGARLRRIDKCLHVEGLDGEALVAPEVGTAQGAVLKESMRVAYRRGGDTSSGSPQNHTLSNFEIGERG